MQTDFDLRPIVGQVSVHTVAPDIGIVLHDDIEWFNSYQEGSKVLEWFNGQYVCAILTPFKCSGVENPRFFAFAAASEMEAISGVRLVALQAAQDQYDLTISAIPADIVGAFRVAARCWLSSQAQHQPTV